jgi:hypothetical protein
MNTHDHFARILGVKPEFFDMLDREMSRATGKTGVLSRIEEENNALMAQTLAEIGRSQKSAPEDIRSGLFDAAAAHEKKLLEHLETVEGKDQFERAARLARDTARINTGFFLKRERAHQILQARPPENVLHHLGYKSVDEMLGKEEVTEVFSALRFLESQEWMHKTFAETYGSFTGQDFEERPIEVRVLGPRWADVAAQFVAKKHHNVSHLKEFGVIFLNPIAEDLTGKFLRDFALLFHYLHEIDFYAKLFKKYSDSDTFAAHLQSLLRGDVLDTLPTSFSEWLIVQRYLWKENPSDPRLFAQRVNPESLHWHKGERDLVEFGKKHTETGLSFWKNRDWVAADFGGELVSLDMEDAAMGLVARGEKQPTSFTYHQREALWTRIFQEYCGTEDDMEKLIIEQYMVGKVNF